MKEEWNNTILFSNPYKGFHSDFSFFYRIEGKNDVLTFL